MTTVVSPVPTSTLAVASASAAGQTTSAFASASVEVDTGRIIDKILKKENSKQVYYSFEYFPPKVDEGKYSLYERFDSMGSLQPAFIDVTWRLRTKELSIEVAAAAQKLCGLETQLHLCIAGLSKPELLEVLENVKKAGIRNILALRGDPLDGQSHFKKTSDGFGYAHELVTVMRQYYGDYFSISVAGYPEGHGENGVSYEDDLKYLKQKVDAGSDYIISQLFFDTDKFLKWVKDCRDAGIKVPILPGILPIQSHASFRAMCRLNPTVSVPKEVVDAVEAIKNDDKAVREYGVKLAVQMCRKLMQGGIYGFHFYTLNLEAATAKILYELGLVPSVAPKLPYKKFQNNLRKKEDVRPIFWAHRPMSYVQRTSEWDEFPNGRWGDYRAPSFGTLNDYHLFFAHVGKPVDRRKIWGESPAKLSDIYSVFVKYLNGEVDQLPWYDRKIETETCLILKELVYLNQSGFLTTNSQPAVNGVESEHKVFGWGPKGGYLYQKAYVEFFCSPARLQLLLQLFPKFPMLSYHAANYKGDEYKNFETVNAVTWGVFPNGEILQPTVVEPNSFRAWKDEAFSLWLSQWASIYHRRTLSRHLVENVHSTFFLVNIVDNDYIKGNIFAIFSEIEKLAAKSGAFTKEEQEYVELASNSDTGKSSVSSSESDKDDIKEKEARRNLGTAKEEKKSESATQILKIIESREALEEKRRQEKQAQTSQAVVLTASLAASSSTSSAAATSSSSS